MEGAVFIASLHANSRPTTSCSYVSPQRGHERRPSLSITAPTPASASGPSLSSSSSTKHRRQTSLSQRAKSIFTRSRESIHRVPLDRHTSPRSSISSFWSPSSPIPSWYEKPLPPQPRPQPQPASLSVGTRVSKKPAVGEEHRLGPAFAPISAPMTMKMNTQQPAEPCPSPFLSHREPDAFSSFSSPYSSSASASVTSPSDQVASDPHLQTLPLQGKKHQPAVWMPEATFQPTWHPSSPASAPASASISAPNTNANLSRFFFSYIPPLSPQLSEAASDGDSRVEIEPSRSSSMLDIISMLDLALDQWPRCDVQHDQEGQDERDHEHELEHEEEGKDDNRNGQDELELNSSAHFDEVEEEARGVADGSLKDPKQRRTSSQKQQPHSSVSSSITRTEPLRYRPASLTSQSPSARRQRTHTRSPSAHTYGQGWL